MLGKQFQINLYLSKIIQINIQNKSKLAQISTDLFNKFKNINCPDNHHLSLFD